MRKLWAIMALVAVLAAAAMPAMAFAEQVTVYGLFEKWENQGYPDDIGGVYSEDGSMDNLVVMLVNGTEARKTELLAMVSDPENMSFDSSAYSFNELRAIQDEIVSMMTEGSRGLFGVGVGRASGVSFGESGNEFRVVASALPENADEYRALFAEKYGDKVYVEEGSAIVYTEDVVDDSTTVCGDVLTKGTCGMTEEVMAEEMMTDDTMTEEDVPDTGDGAFGAWMAILGSVMACALLVFAARRANGK